MMLSGTTMPTATDDAMVFDNDTTDRGVWSGLASSFLCEEECFTHVAQIGR
jgi:hypothetical protein